MKLKFEISIETSLDTVWAAFDNPDNMGDGGNRNFILTRTCQVYSQTQDALISR